jgi:DNA adenine methylase
LRNNDKHKIKNNPQTLLDKYIELWNEFNAIDSDEHRKIIYYRIRDEFNDSKDPYLFYFLNRTCFNGLIRYNTKTNNFNTSLHHNRKGINPKNLKKYLSFITNYLKRIM